MLREGTRSKSLSNSNSLGERAEGRTGLVSGELNNGMQKRKTGESRFRGEEEVLIYE